MTLKLFAQAIVKFLLGVLLVGALIFLPAGTLAFFNGWLLMGILFIPMFFAGFIVAGLGARFGWYTLQRGVAIGGAALFLSAYVIYAEVMRENAYLSRTIEVQENQKVVDTGLYGIVRHPMYSATLILFLSMPIVLGSLYSFLIFLAYSFIIAKRIKGEEAFLERELEGYKEYKQKVKYRLIPFIW